MSVRLVEEKSFVTTDPRLKYCTEHSINPHPAQAKLQEETLASEENSIMLGAPEILHHCSCLIQLVKGKRCLDLGKLKRQLDSELRLLVVGVLR